MDQNERARLGEYFEDNRRNWDARAPLHAAGTTGYELDRYRADPGLLSDIVAFDRDYLGDIAGKRALHLQCHIGTDTLSLARLGATVTGLDQSAVSLTAARELFASVDTEGRFVESNLYDAPAALDGEQFDLVYTGVGAINWLPDIARWGEVVAAVLKPGGTFYIREGHPVAWSLLDEMAGDNSSTEGSAEPLTLHYPYFEQAEPATFESDTTYVDTDGATVAHPRMHEWNHGIGEIFTALTTAGLTVTKLEEHRFAEWYMIPGQAQGPDGRWWLPEAQRELCPMMFTMMATKPL